jgi:hypothetical protein
MNGYNRGPAGWSGGAVALLLWIPSMITSIMKCKEFTIVAIMHVIALPLECILLMCFCDVIASDDDTSLISQGLLNDVGVVNRIGYIHAYDIE